MHRLPTLIILTILQCGCSHDLSNAQPYRAVVGTDVTLVRDMEFRTLTRSKDKPALLTTPYSPGSTSSMDEHLAMAPVGTRLHVTAVKSIYVIKGRNVVAYGTAIVPGTDRAIEWSFGWGHLGGETGSLRRAPWEDPQHVPEDRRLLDEGRVVAE